MTGGPGGRELGLQLSIFSDTIQDMDIGIVLLSLSQKEKSSFHFCRMQSKNKTTQIGVIKL